MSGRAERPLLDRPVVTLGGVGPRSAERLAKLGVETVGDLLCLLPLRYEDRTEIQPLGTLRPGRRALVEGEIELAEVAFRRRRSLLCRLADGTGAITLRFFHFSSQQREQLERRTRVRCFGEVRAGPTGLEMVHPEYRRVGDDAAPPEPTLTPVYPSTEGLHQQRLRKLVDQALAELTDDALPDLLADRLPETWPALTDAIRFLHRPPSGTPLEALESGRHPCRRRIAVEELIAHRLSLKRAAARVVRERATALAADPARRRALLESLPFELTAGQAKSLDEIAADLAATTPMHRLLQGDVGSGKTVVAAAAAMIAADSGYQTAVMAPTELLAEQHAGSFAGWLEPLGIRVVALTGASTGAARQAALDRIRDGSAQVVVGTHALFQQSVRFARLALVVVDEQHRFGVDQRLKLMQKGTAHGRAPHQLVMTATPIPRTLAMTAYADLEQSVIAGRPPGRKPVQTAVIPEQRRAELVARIAAHCASGQQAYWVCPLIEASETLDSQAAESLSRDLGDALPQLSVGLLHGRMKPADKDAVMRAFKERRIDLLVATTVVEVGVDVPSASLMVIENAERMGLAQLHQLRGRVGRGDAASSCVLLYKPPLTAIARERLRVMRETDDGFAVAERDLELRGPGELLGTRQTGMLELRVADLANDADLLPTVIRVSDALLDADPDCADVLIRRWTRSGAKYAQV